jgi:Peptidase inhibitor family I36
VNSHPLTRTWHRYAVALAAALAPALLLLTTSVTAQAADMGSPASLSSSTTALPSCPSSTLCTFQNANYMGTRWDFPWSSYPHGTWFWIGSSANDKISSFYNHRGWTSYFARNCPADKVDWASAKYEGANSNLANNYWNDLTTVNDSISAIALGTSTSTDTFPAHGSC